MNAEQTEQRSTLRGRLEFPVVEHEGGFSFWCTALDLSPTGILLERNGSFARREGSLIELELHLPECPRPVRVIACYAWGEGTRLGLKFVDISDADRLTLAEALDGLLKEGGTLH
jgi:hypothetical protein